MRDRLVDERASYLPTETGGYLIGRRRGRHIEVTGATFQGPEDLATPVSFDRADPAHTTSAVEAWRNDANLSGIVGDWHSHPSGNGSASHTDEKAWRILAQAENAPVAGVVLGARSMVVYVTVPQWMGSKVHRLQLAEETGADLAFL